MYISKKRWQELEKRVAELEKSTKPHQISPDRFIEILNRSLKIPSSSESKQITYLEKTNLVDDQSPLSRMKAALSEALQASSHPDPQHLNQSEYPSQSEPTEKQKAQDNF